MNIENPAPNRIPYPHWYSSSEPSGPLPRKLPTLEEAVCVAALKAREAQACRRDGNVVNFRPWDKELVLTPADILEGRAIVESAEIDEQGNFRIRFK